MTETKIYVGLNDSVTMTQRFETEKYISILRNVCLSYHVAFSFSVDHGGYIHEDGRFTQERTLIISLIDAEKEIVEEIAKDLCVFFHQESVMVTEEHVQVYFVRETL